MFDCVEVPFGSQNLLCAFDGNSLQDLLLLGDGTEDIGAIYMCKVERPVKGIGGVFVSLAGGKKGFWRIKKAPREGELVPLQIIQTAMDGKPPRLTERIDFRGSYIILTPEREGLNVSRAWQGNLDDHLRKKIEALLPEGCGAILRTEAEQAEDVDILEEVYGLKAQYELVYGAKKQGLIAAAPVGRKRASYEWGVGEWSTVLAEHQKDAIFEGLSLPLKAAGGDLMIEQTRALITVDIDTGANTSVTAGKDVNTRGVDPMCRWLRLMGWGGQLVVDPAPMPMQARKGFEGLVAKSAKYQGLDLVSRGFGPLGLFEAQIRYSRRPLPASILNQLE